MTDFQSSDEFHERIWDVEAGEEMYSNLKAGLTATQEILKEAREAKLRQNVREAIIIYASDFRRVSFASLEEE
ncbi:hypothetical protein OESDEN_12872 [Oesophagostomum dentatum]|uniref:Uncharacterized protein n=1 Tax=Oesophagostomum dentatum TaxID=61180 RepID=A0A0B1STY1_OESDE|nr:hypothetical protein OESDEN_12872 [Oesophagostomum dentatum]